mmetsp:Transcript_24639/g.41313  ORF Transcript_24639/g.41313 Transcript_24639/m.41313 type:complete len:494 (-) Transcript_24639:22-1503(-)
MSIATILMVLILVAVVVLGLLSAFDQVSLENISNDDDDFYTKVRVNAIKQHLVKLEETAKLYGNTRAAGTQGYNESVAYVKDQLKATNYIVTEQYFTVESFKELEPSVFKQLTPIVYTFALNSNFEGLTYQASGDITSSLVKAANVGCDAADFAGLTAGKIVVIARGGCSFYDKVQNAITNAGAIGALIYNYAEQTGAFAGTLGDSVTIPVFGITYSIASELIAGGNRSITETTAAFDLPEVSVSMFSNTTIDTAYTMNVIADTPDGSADSIIVQGSHLDSVTKGPGINDNGSGSSTNLEIALQFFEQGIKPKNKVRFAWWGAEELGLKGSAFYVNSLTPEAKAQIALNLNYDMLGSPNFVRGVLNGSQAAEPIRTASATITSLYQEFFEDHDLAYKMNEFTGRSDYGSFLDASIPAGGLQTGAEVIKTEAERALFGGLAGASFDPCYHQACDTVENINFYALNDMAHAAAYVLEKLATQSDLADFLNPKVKN